MGGGASSARSATGGHPLSIVDGHFAILERAATHILERKEPATQVRDILRGGRVVTLFARSGQGKSTFIAQLVAQATARTGCHEQGEPA